MSLTGGKREFEVLSSDSEYLEESSKRLKDENPEVSEEDTEDASNESKFSGESPSEIEESNTNETESDSNEINETVIEKESNTIAEEHDEISKDESSNMMKDDHILDKADEKACETVAPTTKSSGFVFGSAAKTLISFASVGTAENEKPSLFASENQTIEHFSEETNVASKEVVSQNETGEEDEVTIVSGKAKLFQLDSDSKEWKEKGVGLVKLNLCSGENYSRIIMRSDGVPRVLINQRIFPELKFELLQSKNIRFSAIIEDSVQHLLLRFRDAKDATEFTIHLEDHVELAKENI